MTNAISTLLLRDASHGGSAGQPAAVAAALADFVGAAKDSIELAIYDFRLSDALAPTVVGAFTDAAKRGVQVRIGFDAGKPATAGVLDFAELAADPAPVGTQDWVHEKFDGTGVATRAIKAYPQLMHSKYVVRDKSAVWTGSANFTDDAWTYQENNILRVWSAKVAAGYLTDFEQLWSTGAIKGTGEDDGSTTDIGWMFSPGDGREIDARLCSSVNDAKTRIAIATMVITSDTLLTALCAAIDRGVPVSGIYDAGQMGPIAKSWGKSPHSSSKLANWTKLSARLVPKFSTPYSPTGKHDFLHNKILVADGVCLTGSYNFSANAQRNAENQLRITIPEVVESYVEYISTITETYRGLPHSAVEVA
ncbi:phospholipase D-like domain-containing protein [Fodinicola acaciae]|uniref:phospholipase D-like domain-containing protein n=1 Tax=Fodinicola acaciae TaxID=2681555 RepID=UPI0013D1A829|nr:phosphatidylserine/phosphatidylglycerophosphate/cardiolipin synthase family protein [Fodinicola acaciae]